MRRWGLCVWLAAWSAVCAVHGDSRLVVLSVQVRNTSSRVLRQVYLRLPVPVSNEYQEIDGVTLLPEAEWEQDVPPQGRIAVVRVPVLRPGQSAWAFLFVQVESREFQPGQGVVRRRLDEEVRRRCLGPSAKLDPAAPEIRRQAEAIAFAEEDPYRIVRAMAEFLSREFTYELDGRQDDALTVLATRRGSCSELSRLYVALCRARGIPARFAAGSRLRFRSGDIYVDTVHHRWTEVFLPRHGWFPVDISMAVDRADPERRFGSIPRGRLVLLRNEGIADDLVPAYALTPGTHSADTQRTVRTYWFRDDPRPFRQALRLLRRMPGGVPSEALRDELLRLTGVHAVPFLAMGLYDPLAAGDPAVAAQALARTRSPAAAVPLADAAAVHAVPPEALAGALEELTGRRLESGEAWRVWLRSEGLAFLRQSGAGGE